MASIYLGPQKNNESKSKNEMTPQMAEFMKTKKKEYEQQTGFGICEKITHFFRKLFGLRLNEGIVKKEIKVKIMSLYDFYCKYNELPKNHASIIDLSKPSISTKAADQFIGSLPDKMEISQINQYMNFAEIIKSAKNFDCFNNFTSKIKEKTGLVHYDQEQLKVYFSLITSLKELKNLITKNHSSENGKNEKLQTYNTIEEKLLPKESKINISVDNSKNGVFNENLNENMINLINKIKSEFLKINNKSIIDNTTQTKIIQFLSSTLVLRNQIDEKLPDNKKLNEFLKRCDNLLEQLNPKKKLYYQLNDDNKTMYNNVINAIKLILHPVFNQNENEFDITTQETIKSIFDKLNTYYGNNKTTKGCLECIGLKDSTDWTKSLVSPPANKN